MTDPGMSHQDQEKYWAWLLEEEERLFLKCCALDRDDNGKTPAKSKALRDWWSCANAILWMFTRTQAQRQHILAPFPSYFLARLANVSEDLSTGIVPSFVEHTKKAGRALFRMERHHIARGIYYIEAVKDGRITDQAYNKTVRQAFKVTSRTVRNWLERRDEICMGVPSSHLDADQITEKMLLAGATYSKIGRGAPSEN